MRKFLTWGIDTTCYYACHTEDNNSQYFPFHDGSVGSQDTSYFFYVADYFNDATLYDVRLNQINGNIKTASPIDMIYYPRDVEISSDAIKLDYYSERIDLFATRDSWERGGLFASMIGGKNKLTHGQIDAGDFVYHNEGNVWIYNRKKTRGRRNDNAEMRVQIPEQAGKYVAGLKTGRRSSYWLPALHEYSSNAEDMTRFVNKELKRWCRINKDSENLIKWQKLYNEEYFTFYASRKTWATTARRAKIEKSLVDECIAHKGDFAMTDIYAERNWTQINEANSKVIAMFVWD